MIKREPAATSAKSSIRDHLRDHVAPDWRSFAPRSHGSRAALEDVNAREHHHRGVGVSFAAPLK